MASDKQKVLDHVSIPTAFGESASGENALTIAPAANDGRVLPKEEVLKRKSELNLKDTQSILNFGARANSGLREISSSMLEGVRNKDIGPAGESLTSVVTTIKGFAAHLESFSKKPNWLMRQFGSQAKKLEGFLQRYEEVQTQIDNITAGLLGHEHTLLKDIKSLDKLYERTLEFYDELALYIAAGELAVEELDEDLIPEAERELQGLSGDDAIFKAQALSDLRATRDGLERRVHDLKLTRQVTMQSLPSIRLVQENDKALVTKINSTLVNTVPLWQTQLAQAITIHRSQEAAQAVRAANDLTNELLTANAKNLRDANKMVREEMERGVFDIEAVRQANENLVGTIEDSLKIADEGKKKRKDAEAELAKMEEKLKTTLSSAKAKRDEVPDERVSTSHVAPEFIMRGPGGSSGGGTGC